MHDFHLIVGGSVCERLKSVAKRYGLSVSGLCRLFLSVGLGRFEQKFWGKGNNGSKYKRLGEKGQNLHVFLEPALYYSLARIHMDCNFYSISQVARKVLGVVLIVVERRGLGFAGEFFAKGLKKHRKERCDIGEKSNKIHMYMNAASKTEFSAQSVPIAVEFT